LQPVELIVCAAATTSQEVAMDELSFTTFSRGAAGLDAQWSPP
jgi:hypothetical protein